jgi:hypothetical protein
VTTLIGEAEMPDHAHIGCFYCEPPNYYIHCPSTAVQKRSLTASRKETDRERKAKNNKKVRSFSEQ